MTPVAASVPILASDASMTARVGVGLKRRGWSPATAVGLGGLSLRAGLLRGRSLATSNDAPLDVITGHATDVEVG